MKTKLLLLGSLLLPVAVAFAGEPVQIDKNFSFRLDQPAPETSPPVPLPFPPARSGPDPHAPLKTPEGRSLPPGTRTFQFNGGTYYRIPLGN